MDYSALLSALRGAEVKIGNLPDLEALLVAIQKLSPEEWKSSVINHEGSSYVKLEVSFSVWIEKSKEN